MSVGKIIREKWNYLVWAVVSAMIAAVILAVGPMDVFSHGYTSDSVDPGNISGEDFLGNVSLGDGPYSFSFTPAQRHFRGFELTMINIVPESTGEIVVTVADADGTVLDTQSLAIRELTAMEYSSVYLDAELTKGQTYSCTIEAVDYEIAPYLFRVNGSYLGDEVEGDEILVGFVYAESTFAFPEKVMIAAMLAVIWLLVTAQLLCSGERSAAPVVGGSGKEATGVSGDVSGAKEEASEVPVDESGAASILSSGNPGPVWKRRLRSAALFLCLATVLTWDYMYYPFSSGTESGETFQEDSETLVTGVIMAEEQGAALGAYGLGRYSSGGGEIWSYDADGYINDGNWIHGYSATMPQIIVENTEYQRSICRPGYIIEFADGERFTIVRAEESENYLIVTLDAPGALNYYRLGDLSEITIYDTEGNALSEGSLTSYTSQYGLQGRVFRHLARWIRAESLSEEDLYERLRFLCAFAMAVTVCILAYLLQRRYNGLMAACWYGVCLLSQWVVYFANNLYWVEFTWFLPLLVGLVCSMHMRDRRWRIGCYAAAFVTVAVKSLCGYEYISTIMVGLIAFPAAEFARALYEEYNARGKRRSAHAGQSAACGAQKERSEGETTEERAGSACKAEKGQNAEKTAENSCGTGMELSTEETTGGRARNACGTGKESTGAAPGLIFRTIFLLGCAALLGFLLAFAVHASIRGDGNFIAGVQAIYENDYLRIMSGGNGSDFSLTYEVALNASVWETVQKYFRLSTDVVAGVPAETFLLLCGGPIVIIVLDLRKGRFHADEAALYVFFLFGALSWFVLGKSHSYIHTHINYVLWYLGFVQTCFYIILRPICERWKKAEG